MLRQGISRYFLAILALLTLVLGWTLPVHAVTEYDRQAAMRRPQTNYGPRFYGFTPAPNKLPGLAHKHKCIPHGQARCMNNPHDNANTFSSRYTNRSREENAVSPLIKRSFRYEYQPRQNF